MTTRPLTYMMLRSGLVPRRFVQFGIAAGSLALVTAILVLFGGLRPSLLAVRHPDSPGGGFRPEERPIPAVAAG